MNGFIGDTKYNGEEKIVVAIDIGTTHSAVSYAYLYPDDYVRARAVSKWPGQHDSSGSSKIPTLVAYKRGNLTACGSEVYDLLDKESNSHEEPFEMAKWFKLHLHPPMLRIPNIPPHYDVKPAHGGGFEIPPLPNGKTVQEVYTDFMRYLLKNTQATFTDCIPNGAAIWDRLRDSMVVILTTPNGWDLAQQGVLRAAAISAGLIPPRSSQRLLEFVTEGEASVHYTLAYSQSKAWLSKDSVFVVIDAGGSTVDSTLYKCIGVDHKVHLEEVAPSVCVQTGGVFVDRAAESAFWLKLKGSQFATPECILDMVAAFEGRTKRLFDGTQASSVIDFGGNRDNDRARGIFKGKLSLTREEVSAMFDEVVNRIKGSVAELLDGRIVKYAILVGGLGDSPYLQRRLGQSFEPEGPLIVTAEEPAKKAAAEGALIWFIKQTVTSRIAKSTIGEMYNVPFSADDPEHQQRDAYKCWELSGAYTITNAFEASITKGTRISNDFAQRKHWSTFYSDLDDGLSRFESDILVWDGEGTPKWTTDAEGKPLAHFRRLCTLEADLSGVLNSLRPTRGPQGEFYEVEFVVVTRFGGTQLVASIEWEEDGIVREGPVAVIPNALL